MLLKSSFVIFSIIIAASCSITGKPPQVTKCDDFSSFAHSWYTHIKTKKSFPVAKAELNLYPGDSVLSTLKLKDHNRELISDQIFFNGIQGGENKIKILNKMDDYIAILIPPKSSEVNLGQSFYRLGGDPDYLPTPAFLAVPKETFFNGICRKNITPFLISSIENEQIDALPQFNIGRVEFNRLVSGLFLDPDSYDIEALIERISNNRYIDEETWGGWLEVDVDTHRRNIFHWLFKWPEGRRIDIPDIQSTEANSLPLDFDITRSEHIDIAKGWLPIIKEYATLSKEIKALSDSLIKKIKDGNITLFIYRQDSSKIYKKISVLDKKIKSYNEQMSHEVALFITEPEIALYISTMREDLNKSKDAFNNIAHAYSELTNVSSGGLIKPKLFLAGASTVIDDQEVFPSKIEQFKTPTSKLGIVIPASAVAYIEAADNGKYKVRLNALMSLSDGITKNTGLLKSKIYAKQSCSKHVDSVNTSIPDKLKGDSYIKDIDIGVEFRTCWTIDVGYPCLKGWKPKWCKKRLSGWTKVGRTTAKGSVGINVERKAEDLYLSYFYKACIFDFICTEDSGESPSLLDSIKAKDEFKEFIEKANPKVINVTLNHDKNNRKYAAIRVGTDPLDAYEAVVLLKAIKGEL
ncbi:hypothetical protein [Pseudoalteromonas sp. C12FD-1]|uniref:hypothetical protein n=1 Tax=Pseudoalteromonas sp. C12FD-1 TaxID=3131979 RepID=UPI00307EE643